MPRTPVYEAVTERLDILDPQGRVDQDLMPNLDPGQVLELYRNMALMRAFDSKAIKLQRQGRMGTWPPMRGQEAISASVALAMEDSDWLIPAFREQGLMLLRGIPGHIIYAYWAGDERGSSFPESVRCFPIAVPVGSQWQHGAGVGLSLKLRGEKAAAVVFGGDGSTSQGDFHEGINAAGVFKANAVFIIQNNQWAISVPRDSQTSSQTLAQKGFAFDLPCLQVDGNDVFAVYSAVMEALERARSGGGPTLIEAVTYRLGDHTTADDASRYRSDEEVEAWQERDPILRLRRYLDNHELWDDGREEALAEEAGAFVDAQVEALEAMEPQPLSAIFEHMYDELPPHLVEQMQGLEAEVAR
jgi:pyruvate dehydrogenase E1 component alpha subunit